MTYPSNIFAALDTQFVTISFDSTRVIPSNVTYAPAAGKPYLVASIAAYTRRPLTLGTDKTIRGGYLAEHTGTYQVDVVWPQDAGVDGGVQLQQKVLALFPRGTTLTCNDGATVNIDAPAALKYQGDGGAWYRFPVQVPFFSFEAS